MPSTQFLPSEGFYEGDDPNHPTDDQVQEILRKCFSSPSWETVIEQNKSRDANSRNRWYSIALSDGNEDFDIRAYVFRNFAFAHRKNPKEKRIQLTEGFEFHADDFRRQHTGTDRCLLLGMYMADPENPIIVAWDSLNYLDHKTPTSCYASIDLVANAFKYGFSREVNALGYVVCAFRPDFMLYFVGNMAQMLSASGLEPLQDQPDAAEGIEDDLPLKEEVYSDHLVTGGTNIILYGAPGTGKSYEVDRLSKDGLVIRTSFYDTTEFSDFLGSIKLKEDGERVSYGFSPGPFSEALITALRNPEKKVYLVIEEINRGKAAAIFGDIFILLDRSPDGRSIYGIAPPSREFRKWLSSEVGEEVEQVRIPPNLWLLATMNSADQGVYFLDTAFRRRWNQRYQPIDFSVCPEINLKVVHSTGTTVDVLWQAFGIALNHILSNELHLPEDRLLGPWFISGSDMDGIGTVPSKLLIYLWDDILRHSGRSAVFDTDVVVRFGDIDERVRSGKHIFSASLLDAVHKIASPAVEQVAQ
jgi:hypothetical protein